MLDNAAYRVLEFHLTLFAGFNFQAPALPSPEAGYYPEVEAQEVKFRPRPAHIHHMGFDFVDRQPLRRQLVSDPLYLLIREWPTVQDDKIIGVGYHPTRSPGVDQITEVIQVDIGKQR